MSNNSLDLTGVLGTGLSQTTHPDPNTLATKNPYPTTFVSPLTVSSAWTSQGKKALFPLGVADGRGEKPIKLHFVGTTAGATVNVTMWCYNRLSNTWGKVALNGTLLVTDGDIRYMECPGNDPVYLQLGTPSAGTFSVYFDASCALAM